MTHFVWLAPGEQACEATQCTGGLCARKEVARDKGRPLVDFSVPGPAGLAWCGAPRYVRRILPSEAVRPEAKPEAKEWIGLNVGIEPPRSGRLE